jgi:hypothetical protein
LSKSGESIFDFVQRQKGILPRQLQENTKMMPRHSLNLDNNYDVIIVDEFSIIDQKFLLPTWFYHYIIKRTLQQRFEDLTFIFSRQKQ